MKGEVSAVSSYIRYYHNFPFGASNLWSTIDFKSAEYPIAGIEYDRIVDMSGDVDLWKREELQSTRTVDCIVHALCTQASGLHNLQFMRSHTCHIIVVPPPPPPPPPSSLTVLR